MTKFAPGTKIQIKFGCKKANLKSHGHPYSVNATFVDPPSLIAAKLYWATIGGCKHKACHPTATKQTTPQKHSIAACEK